MNRLLLVCLSAMIGCLISCTDKNRIPGDVLSREKMKEVLWDVIQAERYSETFLRDSATNRQAETFKLYAQVFAIHEITRDEFVKSYKFYMSRPDIARDMFDSLSTQASRRRDEYYKPKPVDSASIKQKADSTAVADSIKKLQPPPALPQPVIPQSAVPSAADPSNPRLRRQLPRQKLINDSLMKSRMQLKQVKQ